MAKRPVDKSQSTGACIMTSTALYLTTCKVCEVLTQVMLTTLMLIWAFGESAGRARAASELARLGYHKESKVLMLQGKIK